MLRNVSILLLVLVVVAGEEGGDYQVAVFIP